MRAEQSVTEMGDRALDKALSRSREALSADEERYWELVREAMVRQAKKAFPEAAFLHFSPDAFSGVLGLDEVLGADGEVVADWNSRGKPGNDFSHYLEEFISEGYLVDYGRRASRSRDSFFDLGSKKVLNVMQFNALIPVQVLVVPEV